MIWNPEPGELVLLTQSKEVTLRDVSGQALRAPSHVGQVGIVVGWAGNGLLEVLWPDGTLTGVWAGLGRLAPVASDDHRVE